MDMDPVLGPAIAGLLKVVLDVQSKASGFKSALTRLESTLEAIMPRLDEITRLNRQLGRQNQNQNQNQSDHMEELITITNDGKALVLKCSKISIFNMIKIAQYSNRLLDLDNSLVDFFNRILPLEQMKLTMEVLEKLKNTERLGIITTTLAIGLGVVAVGAITFLIFVVVSSNGKEESNHPQPALEEKRKKGRKHSNLVYSYI